jgi:hypothetical protein
MQKGSKKLRNASSFKPSFKSFFEKIDRHQSKVLQENSEEKFQSKTTTGEPKSSLLSET